MHAMAAKTDANAKIALIHSDRRVGCASERPALAK